MNSFAHSPAEAVQDAEAFTELHKCQLKQFKLQKLCISQNYISSSCSKKHELILSHGEKELSIDT